MFKRSTIFFPKFPHAAHYFLFKWKFSARKDSYEKNPTINYSIKLNFLNVLYTKHKREKRPRIPSDSCNAEQKKMSANVSLSSISYVKRTFRRITIHKWKLLLVFRYYCEYLVKVASVFFILPDDCFEWANEHGSYIFHHEYLLLHLNTCDFHSKTNIYSQCVRIRVIERL